MRIILITGASSGLGAEFARQIDKGRDLFDEFWLVARRKDRLEDLAGDLSHKSRVFPLDLMDKSSMSVLKNALEEKNIVVSLLVCAAGMGVQGRIDEFCEADNDKMIDLNCRAAVDITGLCIPYMKPGGRIIEICSTAGFHPMPGLGVYSASKAFLLTYTKELHYEMIKKGINVTAVCPYWIKDTEFIPKSKKNGSAYKNYLFASTADKVVKRALYDSRANLWVSTPGAVSTVHRFASKVMPDSLMIPIVDFLKKL